MQGSIVSSERDGGLPQEPIEWDKCILRICVVALLALIAVLAAEAISAIF